MNVQPVVANLPKVFAILGLLGFAVVAIVAAMIRMRSARLERESFVRSHVFPAEMLASLNERHPHIDEAGRFLVARALRQFFLVHGRAGGKPVGMPSKVVDDLWHAFILHTRAYERFCDKAFGRFFHHVPASATPKGQDIGEALHLTWHLACLEENINPNKPTRLPLLFAIDEKLRIEGGQHYNMRAMVRRDNSSGCGGSACSGGCSGDAGGCGGGCGGD